MMLNSVLSGNKVAYSFQNIEEKLSLDEVKQNIGYEVDTLISLNDITNEYDTVIVNNTPDIQKVVGIVFIEDWYYDENTLQIKKKVIGIAPLWYSVVMSTSGNYFENKLIPYVIKFDEE